jgi:Cdc6-like AAA superfamily ATPase
MIKKIFGPPGTGKTTTLLNLVDEYIKKGTSLNRMVTLLLQERQRMKQKKEC